MVTDSYSYYKLDLAYNMPGFSDLIS